MVKAHLISQIESGWGAVISKNYLKVVLGISILLITIIILVMSFTLWEKKSKNNANLHEIRHYQWKRKMIYFYLEDLPITLTAILVSTHSKSGGLNFNTSTRTNKSSSSKDILGKPSINKSWQRRLCHRPICTKYLFYWSKPNNCANVIDARSHRTAEWVLHLLTYLSQKLKLDCEKYIVLPAKDCGISTFALCKIRGCGKCD